MLVCACEGARNDGCCWWVGRVDQVEDLDPAALEDVCTPTAGQHAPAAASDAPGSDADSQAAQRSPKRPRTSQAGEVAAPASVFTKARAVYSAGWEAAGEWPSRSCRCCSSLPACLPACSPSAAIHQLCMCFPLYSKKHADELLAARPLGLCAPLCPIGHRVPLCPMGHCVPLCPMGHCVPLCPVGVYPSAYLSPVPCLTLYACMPIPLCRGVGPGGGGLEAATQPHR